MQPKDHKENNDENCPASPPQMTDEDLKKLKKFRRGKFQRVNLSP